MLIGCTPCGHEPVLEPHCCHSVMKSGPTPCSSMDYSKPGFPVLHYLLEFAHTHVHSVADAIQPSHPLPASSPPTLNLSQHQGFFPLSQCFESDGQSIGASPSASVLPMNIQSWFPLGLTGFCSLQSKWLKSLLQHYSLKIINSLALSLISGPTLTSVYDYWKNHSFD